MSRKAPLFSSAAAPGSPGAGEPALLAVGKLRRPHGVHGEMLMEVLTDFPERLRPGITLFLAAEQPPLTLNAIRSHNAGLLVMIDGIHTPEEAGLLRNQVVFVKTAGLPSLPEGEYYHHQLINLQVVTTQGQALGQVVEILETRANDVLVVRAESGPEILIPMVEPFIQEVHLAQGELVVSLIPGMLPGEES